MWESSEALRHGLAKAVELCIAADPRVIATRVNSLASRLRKGLGQIEGVIIRDAPREFELKIAAELGAGRCGIVVFEAESLLGVPSPTICEALEARHIAVSCAPGSHHFDVAMRARPKAVHFSPTFLLRFITHSLDSYSRDLNHFMHRYLLTQPLSFSHRYLLAVTFYYALAGAGIPELLQHRG
jgi:hypothetical protein